MCRKKNIGANAGFSISRRHSHPPSSYSPFPSPLRPAPVTGAAPFGRFRENTRACICFGLSIGRRSSTLTDGGLSNPPSRDDGTVIATRFYVPMEDSAPVMPARTIYVSLPCLLRIRQRYHAREFLVAILFSSPRRIKMTKRKSLFMSTCLGSKT